MRNPLLATLLLTPLFTGCAAAILPVAMVGGAVVGQQVMEDNTYVVQLNVDAKQAWAQAKTSLGHMSLKPIDTDDERRKAVADIDGATATVIVETWDLNKSQMKVSAKKYGFASSETARLVYERLVEDINRSAGG